MYDEWLTDISAQSGFFYFLNFYFMKTAFIKIPKKRIVRPKIDWTLRCACALRYLNREENVGWGGEVLCYLNSVQHLI